MKKQENPELIQDVLKDRSSASKVILVLSLVTKEMTEGWDESQNVKFSIVQVSISPTILMSSVQKS